MCFYGFHTTLPKNTLPLEEICNLGILKEIHQKIYSIFPGQCSISIDQDIKYKLEGLVDVLGMKQLHLKQNKTMSKKYHQDFSFHSQYHTNKNVGWSHCM